MPTSPVTAGTPPGEGSTPVLVLWCPGSSRELAHRLIVVEGLPMLDVPNSDVRVLRHCRSCGSSEHGSPILSSSPGVVTPHVSIGYTEDVTIVALTRAGPVGVDVERGHAASFPGFDTVGLNDQEPLHDVRARTVTWVRKESLLKSTGRGLAVNPRQIQLTDPHLRAGLVEWSAPDPPQSPVWMRDADLADAYVAAVTVLSGDRLELVVRRADPAAQSGRATR